MVFAETTADGIAGTAWTVLEGRDTALPQDWGDDAKNPLAVLRLPGVTISPAETIAIAEAMPMGPSTVLGRQEAIGTGLPDFEDTDPNPVILQRAGAALGNGRDVPRRARNAASARMPHYPGA